MGVGGFWLRTACRLKKANSLYTNAKKKIQKGLLHKNSWRFQWYNSLYLFLPNQNQQFLYRTVKGLEWSAIETVFSLQKGLFRKAVGDLRCRDEHRDTKDLTRESWDDLDNDKVKRVCEGKLKYILKY